MLNEYKDRRKRLEEVRTFSEKEKELEDILSKDSRLENIERWVNMIRAQMKQYEINESITTEIEKNTADLLESQRIKIKDLQQRVKELETKK